MPENLQTSVARVVDRARSEHAEPATVSVSLEPTSFDAGGLDPAPPGPAVDAPVIALATHAWHDAASTMKLPVLIAAHRLRSAGRLDLERSVLVHNDFASRAHGRFALDRDDDSDPQVWDRLGERVPLAWLCRRMIVRSSNLATDLVLEQTGFDPVTEVLELSGTDESRVEIQVQRGIGDVAARAAGLANRVTTAGLNTLLLDLAAGRLAGPDDTAEILATLAANEVDTDVRGGLPVGVWVAHKNGWIDDAVLDAALVRPDDAPAFALSVAVSAAWPNDDAHRLIRAIARLVWDHRDA